MGVDIVMEVRTAELMEAEDFETLRAAWRERFPDPMPDAIPGPYGGPYPDLELCENHPEAIHVRSLNRYYGPHYERGDWDEIRAMGDWLAVRFGETAEVRYGSDSGDTGWEHLTPWPEARAENDAHYAAVGHLPYRPGCSCAHCADLRSTTFDLAP